MSKYYFYLNPDKSIPPVLPRVILHSQNIPVLNSSYAQILPKTIKNTDIPTEKIDEIKTPKKRKFIDQNKIECSVCHSKIDIIQPQNKITDTTLEYLKLMYSDIVFESNSLICGSCRTDVQNFQKNYVSVHSKTVFQILK